MSASPVAGPSHVVGRDRAGHQDPPLRAPATWQERVLGSRYVLGDVIGRGGMADVHLGRDLCSGRRVAIKMLRSDRAQDPLFRASLRREAETMAGLSHPAIASFIDAGYEEVHAGSSGTAPVPFLVMEHVAGWSLRDLLRSGGLTPEESIRYVDGVLSALDASHRAGVIHRDIKPANVMVTSEGAVKLVDFGIARGGSDPTATMTHTQAFLGTPAYLSPEQVRGEAADVRSDLYSAGCLLYELLTGRPPFVGDDPVSVAYQHVHAEPVQVSTDLPALAAVLVTALAKAREDRYQSARAFREALRAAAEGTLHHERHGADPREDVR